MSADILRFALSYAQIALILALALACWRMLRGPRAQDRVLGLDTMYINAMLLFLVIGMGNGNVFFFEGALMLLTGLWPLVLVVISAAVRNIGARRRAAANMVPATSVRVAAKSAPLRPRALAYAGAR